MSRELVTITKNHHNIRPCGKCKKEFKIGDEVIVEHTRNRQTPKHRECFIDAKGNIII